MYTGHKQMLKEKSFQDSRLEEDGSKGDAGLIRFSGLPSSPSSSSSSVGSSILGLLLKRSLFPYVVNVSGSLIPVAIAPVEYAR